MRNLQILLTPKKEKQMNEITKEDIIKAQEGWGNGIVKIGKVYINEGDYKQAAIDHINTFYFYQNGVVLFKPTLAYLTPFRLTFEGALSYFIGGNNTFPEDKGFALTPWTNVRWENAADPIINGDSAVAMGHYFFKGETNDPELKVNYSFGYKKDDNGNIRIILQDSNLPYSPPKE